MLTDLNLIFDYSIFTNNTIPFYTKNERVHSIMIEIRRDLIMDEATGDRKADADKVFSLFPKLIEGVTVES